MVTDAGQAQTLKVCFVGMGSIGTRHFNNLVKIAGELNIRLEIHTLRSTKNALGVDVSLISKQYFSPSEIRDYYNIIFITNPTAMHFQSIELLMPYCENMFIEKPLFHNTLHNLNDLKLNPKSIYYVAAPMRYTDTYQYIKDFVNGRKIYSARSICSSYMPEWQKNRDYTESFRVNEDAGGGVDIDLIHEIDYMVDLFGFPNIVNRTAGHYSDLKMNACDLASYIFVYTDLLVEMHLDYYGKYDKREIELYYDDDVLVGDFINKEVRFLKSNRIVKFDANVDHYYKEMKAYINMIIKKDYKSNENNLYHAFNVLKVAKGEL